MPVRFIMNKERSKMDSRERHLKRRLHPHPVFTGSVSAGSQQPESESLTNLNGAVKDIQGTKESDSAEFLSEIIFSLLLSLSQRSEILPAQTNQHTSPGLIHLQFTVPGLSVQLGISLLKKEGFRTQTEAAPVAIKQKMFV